jgi:adaptin ear-binding coat-associated protein 1/2
MDEIEYSLLQKPSCRAYEIPPAARSTGHLAEEWKNCIFQGKLKLTAKGKMCYIQLLNRENELFLVCSVDPQAVERSVERTRDSSRYFVLTLVTPTGSRAYIGMGFEERNDAFDFWAAILDFAERTKAEEQQPELEQSGPDLSHLRMGEGQTISLGSGKAQNAPSSGTGKITKLRPPPK